MNLIITQCRSFLGRLNFRSLRKLMIAMVGGSVLLVGGAMIVLPGPAILVVPLGLAILATEFLWARRWLKRAKELFQKKNAQPSPSEAATGKVWHQVSAEEAAKLLDANVSTGLTADEVSRRQEGVRS